MDEGEKGRARPKPRPPLRSVNPSRCTVRPDVALALEARGCHKTGGEGLARRSYKEKTGGGGGLDRRSI